jgi:hypothetical protein
MAEEVTYAQIRAALDAKEAAAAAAPPTTSPTTSPAAAPSDAQPSASSTTASRTELLRDPTTPKHGDYTSGDPDSLVTAVDKLPTVDPGNEIDAIRSGLEGAARSIPFTNGRMLKAAQALDAYIDSWTSGTTYDEALKKRQGESVELKKAYPGSSVAGEVVGNAAALGGAISAASRIPVVGQYAWAAVGAGQNQSWIARMVTGGLSSAAIAGGDTYAKTGDAEVAKNAAITSGIVGAVAAPLLGRIMGRVTSDNSPGPEIEAVRSYAQQLYQASEQLGVGVRPDALRRFLDTAQARLVANQYSAEMHAPLAAFLRHGETIVERGVPIPLGQMELFRRHLSGPMRSTDGAYADSTRRLAGMLADDVDNFMTSGLRARDLVRTNPAGVPANMNLSPPRGLDGVTPMPNAAVMANMSPQELARANRVIITNARELWRRQSVASRIEDTIEVAARDRQGLALGMQSQFKALAANPKFMANLRPQEAREIERLGEWRTWRGAGTQLSRMDPTRNPMKAGLGTLAVSTMGGNVTHGLAVPMAGYMAGKAADRAAQNTASTLANQVARGRITPRVDPAGRSLGTTLGLDDARRFGQAMTLPVEEKRARR